MCKIRKEILIISDITIIPTVEIIGDWVNDGPCEPDINIDSSVDLRMSRQLTGTDKSCGPGSQKQTRICIDGTTDKCKKADKEQIISCKDAGTPLPECPGKRCYPANGMLISVTHFFLINVIKIVYSNDVLLRRYRQKTWRLG